MAAARDLREAGMDPLVLEGRDRIGGRTHTFDMTEGGLPSVGIDLGANYIHGASLDSETYLLARQLGVELGDVAGDFWEHLDVATWYDKEVGQKMMPERVALILLLKLATICQFTDLVAKLNCSHQELVEKFDTLLSQAEERACKFLNVPLEEYLTKFKGMIRLQLHKSSGYVSTHEEQGIAFVTGLCPGGVHGVFRGTDDLDAQRVERFLRRRGKEIQESWDIAKSPRIGTASALGHLAPFEVKDLLVTGGYHFLTKHLSQGVRFELNKTVREVEVVPSSKSWGGPVHVRTSDGLLYTARYVICTVPLGVLKGRSNQTSIVWKPQLAERKRSAIKRLGFGAHNKVVLRFNPNDVFWPVHEPNFATNEARFQWLNLHAYDKIGVVVAHIWPPYAYNYSGETDETVVAEVLSALHAMFNSSAAVQPVQSVVTRWDADPWAMGSYSFINDNVSDSDFDDLAAPVLSREHPRVFFAGEHTTKDGNQCVHGAYVSGVRAAREVLDAAPKQSMHVVQVSPNGGIQEA
eukprot:TRINITY_DN43632_c0_g1_i1.p1 TRINITY_DN43632_c0_g1~~TRINITY_DN43632_c0_g1_i1.p1  ORF type:complete len:584 (+),score=64.19 TRINITY_DN43632_c0_g1_i1:189-1754(+)